MAYNFAKRRTAKRFAFELLDLSFTAGS